MGLNHGPKAGDTLRLFLLWGLGAGVGGFLGASATIFQISRAGCLSVGIGWPLILPRLIDSLTKEKAAEEQAGKDMQWEDSAEGTDYEEGSGTYDTVEDGTSIRPKEKQDDFSYRGTETIEESSRLSLRQFFLGRRR